MITAWGYSILKDEPYLPSMLLGHGDLTKMNGSYPYVKYPLGFKWYYLGSLGYHVHQTIQHLQHPARNDFVEMILHHVVTIMLYSFSYLINLSECGATIAFLHDTADIFASFVRCFTETRFVPILLVNVGGMVLTWGYTRLFVLP